MKILIDTTEKTLSLENGVKNEILELYGKRAFEVLCDLWLKTSWNQKYSYTFTWMGRPIIQHPEDMIRLQEVIYQVKPDVVIETGIAHGGSLIYTASLLKAIGKGRVVGVDVEIRPHNRKAIENHELASYIKLVEGDSVAAPIVQEATRGISKNDVVLIILDSNHSKEHVLAELKAYHPFVSVGSYIVATDGLMQDLYDVPRGQPEWRVNNPVTAVKEFVAEHPEFVVEQPSWLFNESSLDRNITGWPDAWLRRIA